MNDKDGMSGAETPVHQPPGRRVVAVVSAKGGVGASVVATNLAVLSAAESTRPVLVVDLCGERGAVARLLGVEPHLRWITVGADHGGPTTLLDSVSIGPGGVRLATAMFDDEAPPATSA